MAPGYLVFARAGSILGVRFDLERGATQGPPITLVTSASMESIWGLVHAAASATGLLAYVPGRDLSVGKLAWVARNGGTEFLDAPERIYRGVRLAPDGSRLAAAIADATDYIGTYDLERREGRRLSGTDHADMVAWSPDSRRLAFRSRAPDAPSRIFIGSADGGAPPIAVPVPEENTGVIDWSPDGKTLGLSYRDGSLRFVSLDGTGERTAGRTDINNLWDFSPDGRWLAYTSAETGQFEIRVRSYPDETVVRQVSVDGGVEPVWCPCGELFYRRGNRWFATRISTAPELRWEAPRLAFTTEFVDSVGTSYDVSHDGQRLLVAKRTAPPVQTKLHIVTNWFEKLERGIP